MKRLLLITFLCLNLPTMISLGFFNIGIMEVLAQSQGENNNWEDWPDYGNHSSDNTKDGGNLPDVVVTGTDLSDKSRDVWNDYYDIYNSLNTLDGGNALGEGNEVVCYGEYPSGSGESIGSTGSPTNPNTNVTPTNPKTKKDVIIVDCDYFEQNYPELKSEVSSVIDGLNKTDSMTIGKNHYLSIEDYINIVWNDDQHEYTTLLVDYDDYGTMLTVPEKGKENEGPFTYTPDSDSYKAIIHNHPTPTPLSAQDIISLLNAHFDGCDNLKTIIAWHPDYCGYYYCATITSEDKAKTFHEKFKDAVNNDHEWENKLISNFNNNHQKEFDKLIDNWDINIVIAYKLQAILDYFDAGISLTTVWFDGEKNSISSLKTHMSEDKKIQFVRCGEIYY